jgi:hypothetical protein
MPIEKHSVYKFICDCCGHTTEARADPNPPEAWYELEDFNLNKNYLYLCEKCGPTVLRVMDLLKIHYEPLGHHITILSTISRERRKI